MKEIKLEAQINSESVFCPCCSIPLSVRNAYVELTNSPNFHPARDKEASSETSPDVDSIKILLVDDHRSFMDGLQMVIEVQKPRMEIVGTATTPDEAIEKALQLKPDVVLLDLDFGDSSGLDILPVLVEKTSARILILTGVRDPDIHDATIVKGAHGVLFKGESVKVMIKAIERVHTGGMWVDNAMLGRVMGQNSASKTAASNDPEARKIASLTVREREIVIALLKFESLSSIEIAANLGISKHTLKNNLTMIYNKLQVKNRVQMVRFALKNKAELAEQQNK